MPVKPVGISFQPEVLHELDKMAAREGENRSSMVAKLVERAKGNGKVPDVRVDGRRFVPARKP